MGLGRLSAAVAASASVLAIAGVLLAPPVHAQAWTYQVFEQIPPGFSSDSPQLKPFVYKPIEKASKHWHICVSHPHMADSYHLSYNYGYVQDAKRLGLKLSVVEAGGYDKLPRQLEQIEDCVAKGANAVIISAISFTGLDSLIAELDKKGIPVIDLGNGIKSDLVKAHSLGSYHEIGIQVGKYLAARHSKSAPANVLWLPGPPGAGWSEAANKGFKESIVGSGVNVLATKYGNSNKPEQLKLVEDGLSTFPNIDYIVGVAPAIEAAVGAVQSAGRSNIKLFAYYQSPEASRLLDQDLVYAMATDSAVIQARVAIDQAVRVLEGQPYIKHVSPAIFIVDDKNKKSWDKAASLAPDGWSAVFSVEP